MAGATACSAERMTVSDSCDEIMALSAQSLAEAPKTGSSDDHMAETGRKFDDLSKRVAEPLEPALQTMADRLKEGSSRTWSDEVDAANEQLNKTCPNLKG